MSIHDKHKEHRFETEIVEYLTSNSWIEGFSSGYDKELAIYKDDLLSYIKSTQSVAYDKMQKREGVKTDEVLCKFIASELDKQGSLYFFRKEIKYIGSKFKLCQFKPELENQELQEKYDANILRVVRQVYYSKDDKKSLDLVLFLNGIPFATLELKTDFTQNVHDAIKQYKIDRLPKNEPILEFKKRCLIHFAVSTDEVYMTTKLDGTKTFFLPFNKGKADGGAGNPPNQNGYATSYLWEEILQRDFILNIIARYIHLQITEKENFKGIKEKKETLIFPRYHQLDVVSKLLLDAKTNGAGKNYLIQHSAGSGKSNSIAWLAHQLASLHDDSDNSVFNSVIVITDRTVLDNQLQETISGFEHKEGVVVGISREGSNESKSTQLADALERGAKIIITTIQTFPFVLEAIQKRTSLKENKYAIIADEAHSSQSGATAKKLKEVLNSDLVNENDEDLSAEDVLNASIQVKFGNKSLSFFAFTATPKAKTLEIFGVLPNPTQAPSIENKPRPFHLYTMKQAIEEGFILDVLKGYTTYKLFYKLEHSDLNKDYEVESKKAKIKIAKWLNIHPFNISQKTQIIIEHFKTHISHLLDNQAKAMVVTSSRQSAVRYKIAFDKYIKDNDLSNLQAMVAFSGKVNDDSEGSEKEYTESNLNPNLKGRDMRKAFDTNEYQVMLVANKFQTGFDQPKLCAMYVDKKLGGVDCVQTLSRLNRTYAGKEHTFILDFVNELNEIKEAFEPYYKTSELEDVTNPNIVYDIQMKLEGNGIFTQQDIDNYANAFFNPKGTQAQMSSALKPSIDRYKGAYKDVVVRIKEFKDELYVAKNNKDEKGTQNLERNLKEANEKKNALDLFKKDMISFTRLYEFLSQIVDYEDIELEKLWAFAKGLIPNIRTYDEKEDVDISLVKLTHYKLHKQRQEDIKLEGNRTLSPITDAGSAVAKDPEKEFLSKVVEKMNALFQGDFTEDDVIGYLNTITTKVMENEKVVLQVKNNTKEQAMLGGFSDAINDAVIDSLDAHQSMATQVLSEDSVRIGLANMVYDLIIKGLRA